MLSLIVNPAAGGGRTARALPQVLDALSSHGLEHHVEPTRSLDHARQLARQAASDGELAVAFGGDGLVAAVAGALCDTDGVLGVLPGGRGNDFVRCVGVPLDPVGACRTLATGALRRIDLGSIGDSTFLGIATCGFDATANRIANATRLPLGNLVYAYGGLRALARWRPIRFTLRLDGEELAFTGYSVAVANAPRHGGGMLLAPDARLDDGLFDVVMVSEARKLAFLWQLPRVFRGRHVDCPYVRIVRATEIEVCSDRATDVYADGDPVAELPATLTVRPRSIQVKVPV